MADQLRKLSLRAELDSCRTQMSRQTDRLRHDVAFGDKLKSGVVHHPAAWFGGAAMLGLLLSRIPFGSKHTEKVVIDHGDGKAATATAVAMPVLKMAMNVVSPVLSMWMKRRAGQAF